MVRKLFGAIVMVLLAAAAGLPLSGLAHADEGVTDTAVPAAEAPVDDVAKAAQQQIRPGAAAPAEVVDGECSSTVLGARGKPLLVDADALVGDGVLPAVRLGSSTDRIAEESAVNLPVGDVVEQLGVRDIPVVGQVAEAGCGAVDTAGDAVDQVAATTSALATPVQASVPQPVDPVDPQPPLDEVPVDGEVGEVVDVETLPEGALQSSPLTATPALASLPLGPLPRIEVPLPDTAAQSTDMRLGGRGDELSMTNTGQVTALPQPAAVEPAKAPFVLAVGLLAAVAGVLVRRWITRSAA